MVQDEAGVNYIVSAGHCGDPYEDWTQGTNDVGMMAFRTGDGKSDSGMIGQNTSISYTGGRIYTGSSSHISYDRTENASQDYEGEAVSMSGASSNYNSIETGFIEDIDFSWTVGGHSYTDLRKASYTSEGGDSGGTVYLETSNGVRLKGINKGHTSTSAVYSQMEHVMDDLEAMSNRKVQIQF